MNSRALQKITPSARPHLCWLYLQARRSQDPEELRWLSFSDSEQIRRAIATNVHAPGDVVNELCRDWCSSVRSAAALNPNTGFRFLSRLVEDDDSDVRLAAAQALAKHCRLLQKLTQDQNPKVRAAARSALQTAAETVEGAPTNVTLGQFGRAA